MLRPANAKCQQRSKPQMTQAGFASLDAASCACTCKVISSLVRMHRWLTAAASVKYRGASNSIIIIIKSSSGAGSSGSSRPVRCLLAVTTSNYFQLLGDDLAGFGCNVAGTAGAMASLKFVAVCFALLAMQQLAEAQRRGPPGPRGARGPEGPPGPPGPPGLSAIPTSWSDVIILDETSTVSAANAATSSFVFTAGSCANIQKTATLGGTASVQCFNSTGAPNWPMTAKWTTFSIHNTIMPGDAPACDILTDSASPAAAPRTSCPFFVRYIYNGDLAADLGAGNCVFRASLYCVKPKTAAAAGRSLFIGTGAAVNRR